MQQRVFTTFSVAVRVGDFGEQDNEGISVRADGCRIKQQLFLLIDGEIVQDLVKQVRTNVCSMSRKSSGARTEIYTGRCPLADLKVHPLDFSRRLKR